MKFTVDAASLTDKQTCSRRFILNSEWRLARWRPKLLFDTLLRRGILQLTQQIPVAQVADDAKSVFLLRAADPGLDIIGKDPYQASKGWCSLLESVLHGVSRTTLSVLHDPEPAKVTSSIDWRFLSWADDSGTLHRWVSAEAWDDETLSRELHSWRTFGDLAMSGCPMVLHAIILGQNKDARFYSPWTRTYVHPAIPNLRWQWIKPHNTREKETTWKSIQLVDQNKLDVEEWIDQAWAQGAIQPLLQDQEVNVPHETVLRDTKYQIIREAEEMQRLQQQSYLAEPMSRGSCDLYSPCHYQNVCYSATLVNIEESGLYVRRKASYITQQTEVPAL